MKVLLFPLLGLGVSGQIVESPVVDPADCIRATRIGDGSCEDIPDGTKSICKNGFGGCQNTGTLVIPDSVTFIGESAFAGNRKYSDLQIGTGVTVIHGNTFQGCLFTTKDWTIPSNIKRIGSHAFVNSNFTGTLTIPSTVERIDTGAFIGNNLEKVKLVSSLTVLMPAVFKSNDLLLCYEGVLHPGELPSIIFPFGVETCGLTSACYKPPFGENSGPINIPAGTTEICASAFLGHGARTGPLVIPNTVKFIGQRAFLGCQQLSGGLTLPSALEHIGQQAFAFTSGLTGTFPHFPLSLLDIGRDAFKEQNLTGTVYFPKNVKAVGGGAFADTSVTHVVVESASTVFGIDVFGDTDLECYAGPLYADAKDIFPSGVAMCTGCPMTGYVQSGGSCVVEEPGTSSDEPGTSSDEPGGLLLPVLIVVAVVLVVAFIAFRVYKAKKVSKFTGGSNLA